MDASTTRNRKQQKEKVTKNRQFTKEEKIELHSFITSLVFHTFLLLFLSLICEIPVTDKLVVVSLSFSSSEDLIEPNLEANIVDISSFSAESAPENHDPIEASSAIVEAINNTSIDLEAISFEDQENTDHRKSLSESIPIESLTAVVNSSLAEGGDKQKDTPTQEPQTNVLESLIKTTSAGLLAQNKTANMFRERSGSINRSGSGISQRLTEAGAQTGDIQISIAWDTIDDIDLHVIVNTNGHLDIINWTRRIGTSGGMLDVDMNANNPPLVNQPVENIFWPHKSYPRGSFMVGVHFFRSWTGNRKVPVLVRVKNGDSVETFNIIAIIGQNVQEVTRFNY